MTGALPYSRDSFGGKMTDLHYPLNEYSDDWNPTGGLMVPLSDLPAPTNDNLGNRTSDDLVQD